MRTRPNMAASPPFLAADADEYEHFMGRWSNRLTGPFLDFAEVRPGDRVFDPRTVGEAGQIAGPNVPLDLGMLLCRERFHEIIRDHRPRRAGHRARERLNAPLASNQAEVAQARVPAASGDVSRSQQTITIPCEHS